MSDEARDAPNELEAAVAREQAWRIEAQARARALGDAIHRGAHTWQGDGTDDLASLSDAAVVVVTAGDLRKMLRDPRDDTRTDP